MATKKPKTLRWELVHTIHVVLLKHDGLCLDNYTERAELALAIAEAVQSIQRGAK